MRTLDLAAVLGLASLSAASRHREYHRDLHRDLHRVVNRDAHRHADIHARDYAATVVELVTEYVTKYVYDDGTPASAATSFATSVTTDRPAAVFKEIPSSSSIPTTTSTTSIVVPTTSVAAPAPSNNAAAAPAAPAAPDNNYPPKDGERVFTVINMHTNAVSTGHDDTVGTPTSAGAPLAPGTMAPGAAATFAVPQGWVGNVAIVDAAFPLSNDATLIEGNYNFWGDMFRPDFDISFVNGFTLPATCSCGGTVTTGCNLNLNSMGSCPSDNVVPGGCANPLRSDVAATAASLFFQPCEGAAWTFVNDGKADSNCPTGDITCCIGTACPGHPNQKR